MTILSMITLSALVLICLSHMAASRAQKQDRKQRSFVPVRVRYSGRR
ncbi:hypothetical protein [Rhizobium herbae]|uniref:Uncharacterized protein n=1 Tax=Rhizobium herbae TaxID=508661 RepID=A0ABS4ENU8_9HYPH|nr:hypothetical protein [Rhizobium herbae]MBP1859491.1 hypothetical protein [Rhizobium herbae]